MNETIINNWNNIVKKDDIVYHLGDLASSNILKNFSRFLTCVQLIPSSIFNRYPYSLQSNK